MKTNKEKNQDHDARVQDRVRPAAKHYEFKELEAVIRSWITGTK